tara:strand:+ start:5544 stop:5768 length:225 start_codon:yes stop_codon:yes gene_type:complete
MRYGIRLPEHSGSFIHSKGGWGGYHKWLISEGIAKMDSAGNLVRLPQSRPKKISRNAPCPCGSGKKYKKCCINK